MANSYIQYAYGKGKKVDDVIITAQTDIILHDVEAKRIILSRNCKNVLIDGFCLTGPYSMPLLIQDPNASMQGVHLVNGYIDSSASPDVDGDKQAISMRVLSMEDFGIHDVWINGHNRNAIGLYKNTASTWKDIEVDHIYVTNGRDMTPDGLPSGAAGGILIGSDNPAGSLAVNCRVHDCLIERTVGYGIRRKDFGVTVTNVIGQNNEMYGATNVISGESAEDIRARVVSRIPRI